MEKNQLLESTDVIVTADHGFSTISNGALDASGASRVRSYAAATADGSLPRDFLAIDLAHALQKDDQLYNLDVDEVYPHPTLRFYPHVDIHDLTGGIYYGSALIGGSGKADHSGETDADAEIITVPSGNSELIYLPHVLRNENNKNDRSVVARVASICDFLTQQDYVDGVFVRDDLGEYPGTLKLSDIRLYKGSAKLTEPAIVVNFKGFPLDPQNPWYTWVEISGGRQGQGMHGGLNRADTFNATAAEGPDFKQEFQDALPVSNADLARTIAHILELPVSEYRSTRKPPMFEGRVLHEALSEQRPYRVEYWSEIKASRPTEKRFRTVLHLQKLLEHDDEEQRPYVYLDQACLVAVGNDVPRCKYPTGLAQARADCEPWLGPNVCAVWTQMAADKSLQVRVVSSDGECPDVFQDGERHPMKLRAGANEKFPAVCQFKVTAEKSLTLFGHALPIPPKGVHRIAVFGDTGCRIKTDDKGTTAQGCNDPEEWPFRDLAEQAADARHRPDLVLHVGDYYYRESKCPENTPGCKDSPWGDRWQSWNKDFFEPARDLLAAAPWVFVRGNHEDCKRGGEGWSRFLDPEIKLRKCPINETATSIHLPDLNLYVLDSADAEDDNALPANVGVMEQQLKQIKDELAMQPGWILVHHPFWGIRPKDLTPVNRTLQAALDKLDGPEPLPGLELVISGHIHEFSSLDFAGRRPPQWIVGSGGDKLEVDPPFGKRVCEVVDGLKAEVFMMEGFGFVILDRKSKDHWEGKLRDARNHELAVCDLELKDHRLYCNSLSVRNLCVPGDKTAK